MPPTVRMLQFLAVQAILIFTAPRPATPCSTFVLGDGDELVFGANLDFYTSRGLVVVNQRGVAKTGLLGPPETPVQWVSKYGSVTFNQMGCEFPFGGMNEQGLVIQMMWLDETTYPPPDDRPALTELQWIQYQLDHSATMEEVLQSDHGVRISSIRAGSRLHYLVCDRQGNVATVEFLDGHLVSRSGADLPVAALTNSTYSDCLAYRAAIDSLGADPEAPATSYDSRDRFVRIGRAQQEFAARPDNRAVDFAFSLLQSVSAPKRGLHCTAWSIVYDIRSMRLHFRTFENQKEREIDFRSFDYACSPPAVILDMNADSGGDVTGDFVEYSTAANVELLTSVLKSYHEAEFLTGLGESFVQMLAHYPEHFVCE